MDIIKFSPPDITEVEINEVVDTLNSGWITTGPKTQKFEKMLADFCGTDRVVALYCGTAAMRMTLELLGVGPGDEVITTAYTYTATCSVICHAGATPVLVDCGKDSYEIDYDAIADAITEKTKVIIPVDIAGAMCDYDRLYEIVESKKDLFKPEGDIQEAIGRVIILADSAHGLGASYKGKRSGAVADFTSFSFHAVKNLTTSEGGAVTWRNIDGIDNDDIYKRFQLFSLHGQTKTALAKSKVGGWEYDVVAPYYKCNMTDILAALGIGQLKRYEDMLKRRDEIMKKYIAGLDSSKVELINHYVEGRKSSIHLCLTRIIGKDREYCNDFIQRMAAKGIPLNVHYKPLPMLTAYKNLGFDINDFPNAKAMYENEVTLPLHTLLTDEQIDYIIKSFNECLSE